MDDLAPLGPAERKRTLASWQRHQEWSRERQGYADIQSTRPQTLAYALTDSPVGQLAWIAEKFKEWTDSRDRPEDAVDRDQMLTNVMLYWLTGTAGSSARIYYERAHADYWGTPTGRRWSQSIDLMRAVHVGDVRWEERPRSLDYPSWLHRRSATGLLAEFPEERPYVTNQQFRLLHGSEVPASLVLRPLHDVVRPLRDVPQRDEVVVREVGQRGRRRRGFGCLPANRPPAGSPNWTLSMDNPAHPRRQTPWIQPSRGARARRSWRCTWPIAGNPRHWDGNGRRPTSQAWPVAAGACEL